MGNNTCQFHTTVKVSLIITGAILDSLQLNGSINFKTVSLFMTYKLHFFHSFHNGRNSRRMAVTTVQNIKVYSRQNRTRLQKLERAVKLFVYRHIEDYCVQKRRLEARQTLDIKEDNGRNRIHPSETGESLSTCIAATSQANQAIVTQQSTSLIQPLFLFIHLRCSIYIECS